MFKKKENFLVAPGTPRRVRTFTPHGHLSSPVQFVRQMIEDLVRSRHAIWEMFRRDMKSQYRQSGLGILFSLLPTLSITAWAILFRSANLINVGTTSVPYPFFVLSGMMIWTVFLESIEAPIQGVQLEQALLSKSSLPPEAVTFSRLGHVVFNFFVKAVMLVVVAAFYRLRLPWTGLLVPAGIALLAALGSGIGLILSPINLLYRDVAKALPVVLVFWFFLTPVLFVSPQQGAAHWIMGRLNPVTPILMATRNLIFPGSGGPVGAVWVTGIFAVVLFCVGLIFHRIAMPVVIDRTNA